MIFLTIFLLACMEIALSFDNAILNASTLRTMPKVWQNRFLTWGMLIAVFGMRLVFPIVLVSFATHLPMGQILTMAIYSPDDYAKHLTSSHTTIAAFGGIFLLMIFLKFLMDSGKEVHWIAPIESRLSKLGKLESIEICCVLALILLLQFSVPAEDHTAFQITGILSVIIYLVINGFNGICESYGSAVVSRGLMGFIYLEFLDASCSFDGVIGAFVLTNNILLIMIGLGIGAFAIRSLTLHLVRDGTLQQYIYLEHGANYGIGALAVIMLTDIFYPVPEPITGMIGLSFIGLSLWSSIQHNKNHGN